MISPLANFMPFNRQLINQKEKKMNNKEKNIHWEFNLKPTRHFIERYYERILNKYLHEDFQYKKAIKKIFKDMNARLLEREKNFLQLFVNPQCDVILPMGGVNEIVIKKGKLITVMN